MALSSQSSAFIDEDLRVPGAKSGPLEGLTVAIKDLFDVSCFQKLQTLRMTVDLRTSGHSDEVLLQVAGHPTGFGNPTWLATHPKPTANASCVQVITPFKWCCNRFSPSSVVPSTHQSGHNAAFAAKAQRHL